MLLFILFFLNKVLELLYREYILVSFHKCGNVHLRMEEIYYTIGSSLLLFPKFSTYDTHIQ